MPMNAVIDKRKRDFRGAVRSTFIECKILSKVPHPPMRLARPQLTTQRLFVDLQFYRTFFTFQRIRDCWWPDDRKRTVLTKGEVSPGVQMRVSCMYCYPCECEEKDPLHAIGCRLVGVSIACLLQVWRRMSARFLRAEGNACTGCMHGPRLSNIGACLLVPFCRVARTLSGEI